MTTSNPVACGIDWSLTSPAITIFYEDGSYHSFAFNNTKKQMGFTFTNLTLSEKIDFSDIHQQDRFDRLSDWAINIVKTCKHILLEDYAYSANGNITSIAECCGLLKYKLFKLGIEVEVLSTTALKKYATGKGNCKKHDMVQAFNKDAYDIYKSFEVEDKNKEKNIPAPVTDICDSYWLAKYALENRT